MMFFLEGSLPCFLRFCFIQSTGRVCPAAHRQLFGHPLERHRCLPAQPQRDPHVPLIPFAPPCQLLPRPGLPACRFLGQLAPRFWKEETIEHECAAGSRANRQAWTPALRCRTFCDKEGRDRRHQEWILEHAVAEWVIKCITVIHLICNWIQGTYRNAPFGIEVLVARC